MANNVVVQPTYVSIAAACDVAEPWIMLWSGDEWGESMRALLQACHTSYAFSDEDCALFTTKLFDYLQQMREWMDEEGQPGYGMSPPEQEAEIQAECRETRARWLEHERDRELAKVTLASLPGWVFGE